MNNDTNQLRADTTNEICTTLPASNESLNSPENAANKGRSGGQKIVGLSVLLANARSLAPKIKSLIEYFEEYCLQIAIITESWLKYGDALDEAKSDLEMGENISIIHRNRLSKRGRTAGGGVLIAYDRLKMNLKEMTIRRGQSEIVCATGKMRGLSRKIVVMSVYLPPKLSVTKAKESLTFVSDAVGRIKDELSDPIFIIGGDFNKFDLTDFMCDFPDIKVLDSPPTRQEERLDLILSNVPVEAEHTVQLLYARLMTS